MKNWKRFAFTAVFLLIGGVFYVNAQDMIVQKDGNMIEAKVVEISPTEIRYKRFDHLDGPTIVIPTANVLSIKYENGNYEIINAGTMPQQANTQAKRPNNTAMDPNKFIFGINANVGGALGNIWGGPTGTGINIELGKGNFNSEINLMFPSGGFGLLATFNGFVPSRIGGFYVGGGLGFSTFEYYDYEFIYITSFIVGLNIGYKFVTPSGVYFRTGAFGGLAIGWGVYIKPDLAIGWTMR